MRINLAADPDVVAIALTLGLSEDDVTGKLLRFWGWADQHTTDGNARSVTTSWIDKHIGVTGFAATLIGVGWLERTEDGVRIPGFDRFLGKSGKTRAKSNRRVAAHREVKRNGNASSVTKPLPEKRTEEKKEEPKGSSKSQPESATRRLAFSEWDAAFAQRMHADILAVVPSAKEPSFDAWANDLRLIREQDRRSEAEIEALWSWANSDSFWRSVLLSPRKLREKWTQLEAKRSSQSRAGPKHGRDLMRGHRDFEAMLEKANGSQAVQQPDDGTGNGNRPRLLG